jgi:type IV secretion system protein VirB1
MPIDLPIMMDLAQACAPAVAASTLLAVAQAESGYEPLAIGVNGRRPARIIAPSKGEAITIAERLIAAGGAPDLGLAQINARNLAWLGLTVADAFDPCRNLAASARVLAAGYDRAGPQPGAEQAALRTALSYYNTGDPQRGFHNGYVAKVTAAVGRIVPALQPGAPQTSAAEPTPAPPPPAWDVFAKAASPTATFVINPQSTGDDR